MILNKLCAFFFPYILKGFRASKNKNFPTSFGRGRNKTKIYQNT